MSVNFKQQLLKSWQLLFFTHPRRYNLEMFIHNGSGMRYIGMVILIGIILISACGQNHQTTAPYGLSNEVPENSPYPVADTPTPTYTPTSTSTNTRTPRPSRTPTLAPTSTDTLTPVGTLTPTPLQNVAGPFKSILAFNGAAPGVVQHIFVIDEQTVFLSGTFGLLKLDLKNGRTNLSRGFEQVLGVDRSGRAWVLRNNGGEIAAWDGENWQIYGPQQGWILRGIPESSPLPSPGFVYDTHGNMWVATSSDIRSFDGKRWQVIPAGVAGFKLPYKAGVSTSIVMTTNPLSEEVWVGTCDWQNEKPTGEGNLRVLSKGVWQDGGFPPVNACMSAIQVDENGTLWLAAGVQIWSKYVNQPWQNSINPFSPPTGQHDILIEEIAIQPGGSVWPLFVSAENNGIAIARTRYQIVNGFWTLVRQITGLEGQKLFFLPNMKVWALEQGTIYEHVAGESWELVTRMNYRDATLDSNGAAWLVTDVRNNPSLWKASP